MNIPDYSSFSKDELIEILNQKEVDYQSLRADLERYKQTFTGVCDNCEHNPLR